MLWPRAFTAFRPGRLSTADELARAEAVLGFALPGSYRAFCAVCGAGLANGQFRIATPLPYPAADLVTRAGLIAHSIGAAIEALAGNPELGATPHRFDVEGDDATILDRACFFGEAEDGGFLFWDVRGSGEYDVWVLGADLESVRFGGETLYDFVRATQGEAVRGPLGMAAAPLPASFEGFDAGALAVAEAQEA